MISNIRQPFAIPLEDPSTYQCRETEEHNTEPGGCTIGPAGNKCLDTLRVIRSDQPRIQESVAGDHTYPRGIVKRILALGVT
jgi:hypothetical protein